MAGGSREELAAARGWGWGARLRGEVRGGADGCVEVPEADLPHAAVFSGVGRTGGLGVTEEEEQPCDGEVSGNLTEC